MGDKSKLEQNQHEQRFTTNGRVALIGAFGGVIWSILAYFCYILNFTKFGPALILAPVPAYHWKNDVGKQLLGIAVICLVSIVIAFIYKWTLARVKTLWISIGFGLVLWVIVFYILEPWIPGLKPVTELGKNTISTTLSLYAMYGLFVGYSISFDILTTQDDENAKG